MLVRVKVKVNAKDRVNNPLATYVKLCRTKRCERHIYIFAGTGIGFNVIVHGKGEFPSGIQDSFSIQPGTSINVALLLQEERILPRPYSSTDCVNDVTETTYPYGFMYSENACREFCKTEEIYRDCCDFYELNPNASNACNYNQVTHCSFDFEDSYARGNFSCNHCLPTCQYSEYKLHISTSKYPDPLQVLQAQVLDFPFQTEQEMSENLLSIRFYFKSMKYVVFTQTPSTNVWQFFSTCGGILGLFLGASILTVVEIFDFVLCLLVLKVKKVIGKTKIDNFESHRKTSEEN